MRQLKIGTIPLPKLYVCSPGEDITQARELGVPYIIKPDDWSDEKLVKAVLWRTLHNLFPDIMWLKVLGFTEYENTCYRELDFEDPAKDLVVHVSSEERTNTGGITHSTSPAMDQSDDYRLTNGGSNEENDIDEWGEMGIDSYIGDLGWYVNIEELQALHVLPVFLDDIATAIKRNVMSVSWMDGWNKKLDAPMGSYAGGSDAPNLIILDVSGSIPSGVAGTMVSLIDTLRSQANADLIITGERSQFWAANTELPSPDVLAWMIGGCNECSQFYEILRKRVLGKHWGNVIVFGDNDAPNADRFIGYKNTWLKSQELQSTRIDRILAFHTYRDELPGYGLWAKDAAPKADTVINTSWVSCMRH